MVNADAEPVADIVMEEDAVPILFQFRAKGGMLSGIRGVTTDRSKTGTQVIVCDFEYPLQPENLTRQDASEVVSRWRPDGGVNEANTCG